MRHRKAGLKLNRTSSHRKAMFRNMVTSLFKHERIRTTDVKAKELRRWAENLITLAKRGDLHARRQALSIVREKDVVHKLFAEAAEKYGAASGGYTRIVKLGRRSGDAAPISMIELISPEKVKKKKKKAKVVVEKKPVAEKKKALEDKAAEEKDVVAEEKPDEEKIEVIDKVEEKIEEVEAVSEDADEKAEDQAVAPVESEKTEADEPEAKKTEEKPEETEPEAEKPEDKPEETEPKAEKPEDIEPEK